MPVLLAFIDDCYMYVFKLNSRSRKYILKSSYLVEISQKNIGTWKMTFDSYSKYLPYILHEIITIVKSHPIFMVYSDIFQNNKNKKTLKSASLFENMKLNFM